MNGNGEYPMSYSELGIVNILDRVTTFSCSVKDGGYLIEVWIEYEGRCFGLYLE
jgi:hypothetical protein